MGIPGTTIKSSAAKIVYPFSQLWRCDFTTSQTLDLYRLCFPFLSPCTKKKEGSRDGRNGFVGVNFIVFCPSSKSFNPGRCCSYWQGSDLHPVHPARSGCQNPAQ